METSGRISDYLDSLPGWVGHQSVAFLAAAWQRGEPWLLADLSEQTILLMRGREECRASYSISSSHLGEGNLLDSGCTPLGLHRVCARIGEGLARGAVIRHRVPTGELATAPAPVDPDTPAHITSRVLRLTGLNPAYNAGLNDRNQCVDSYERCIYIHGTDRRFQAGQKTSSGCLTLADADVIDLFDKTPERALVLIVARDPQCRASSENLSVAAG